METREGWQRKPELMEGMGHLSVYEPEAGDLEEEGSKVEGGEADLGSLPTDRSPRPDVQ